MAVGHEHHDHDHSEAACREAIAELYTYLDGELTIERRAVIQRHLDGCNPCLEAYDFEAELRIVVQHHCHEDVPESLRQRIFSQLGGERQSPSAPGQTAS
jgi:mycothiol system anti-sigma-R factor